MTVSTPAFQFLRDMLKQDAAIDLDQSKSYLVELRLGELANAEGFSSICDMLEDLRIKVNLGLRKKVVDAMTTNETLFFRDHRPFECLRTELIPKIIASRQHEKVIRIWSGACSTGQEPYSLAMLLQHHFAEQLYGWDIQIYATDISQRCLSYAQEASYTRLEVNRGLPAIYLVHYFDQVGPKWQVNAEIQKMVQFQQLNLIESWETLPQMDLVLMRNVLIYFNIETKKQILTRIRRQLRADGSLFLGSSETTYQLDERFYRKGSLHNTFYYQLFE